MPRHGGMGKATLAQSVVSISAQVEQVHIRRESASGCGDGGYDTQGKQQDSGCIMTVVIKFLQQSLLSSGHPSGPPPLQR